MADGSANNLVAIVAIFAIVIVACVVIYYVFASEQVVTGSPHTSVVTSPDSAYSSTTVKPPTDATLPPNP